MSHRDFIHFTRSARVHHRGLTVGVIRLFLAEVEANGIDDDTRVVVVDRVAVDAGRQGHITAMATVELNESDGPPR